MFDTFDLYALAGYATVVAFVFALLIGGIVFEKVLRNIDILGVNTHDDQ